MESALDTAQGMEDLSFWSFHWEMQMVHQSSVQPQPCAFVSTWLHALPPSRQLRPMSGTKQGGSPGFWWHLWSSLFLDTLGAAELQAGSF